MRKTLKRGAVQIYTGDGKGKTTAAIGLAVRAAGAGYRVYIQQFIKSRPHCEANLLKRVRNITIEQCGHGPFIKGSPSDRDISCARSGLTAARTALASGAYDVVILDEINVAVKLGLISARELKGLVAARPRSVELVLTGRGCPKGIVKLADIATEMKMVAHHYRAGVKARRGIEY